MLQCTHEVLCVMFLSNKYLGYSTCSYPLFWKQLEPPFSNAQVSNFSERASLSLKCFRFFFPTWLFVGRWPWYLNWKVSWLQPQDTLLKHKTTLKEVEVMSVSPCSVYSQQETSAHVILLCVQYQVPPFTVHPSTHTYTYFTRTQWTKQCCFSDWPSWIFFFFRKSFRHLMGWVVEFLGLFKKT